MRVIKSCSLRIKSFRGVSGFPVPLTDPAGSCGSGSNFFRIENVLDFSFRQRHVEVHGHHGPHVVGEQPGVQFLRLSRVVNGQVLDLEGQKY